ncbi:NAD(P)H-hydrate dehydratase [Candidatus Poriferisodalis sp.]|uniref:NAD(P)H-hydrate dehydratase n=1 Tax=Candidatus Poriferisodalis sp. TaxID=3101277 RepID=UPI003B014E15
MIPIVTPAEMAAIDAAAPEGTDVLVARAGAAVAIAARRMMGGTYGRRVLVAAGKGNNGADGRVAAAALERWGVRCRVVTPPEALELVGRANSERLSRQAKPWPERPVSAANKSGKREATKPEGSPIRAGSKMPTSAAWDLVIDAAYGTGLRGSWGADRAPAAPVLAVDIPSGIDALTGEDHGCWPAALTVTFGALKPGLLLHPGAAAAGEVELAPIGLDASGAASWLVTDADADAALPAAEPAAHKWRRAVRVIAGSPQMRGAGHLVCAAAQQAGAGMVVASSPGVRAADVARPAEAVARDLRPGEWAGPALDGIKRFDAAIIGPGIGTDPTAMAQAARFIADCPVPLVVDADGLTALADHPECLYERTAPTVLTPHDGEFAKLTGSPPAADRFDAVSRAAEEFNVVVLLKGPTTLVAARAAPEADTTVVLAAAAGTARLATAGSGDVLSGMIAAVLSAGATEPGAVLLQTAAAAHWHGRTATFGGHGAVAALTPLTAMHQVELLGTVRAGLAASGAEMSGT